MSPLSLIFLFTCMVLAFVVGVLDWNFQTTMLCQWIWTFFTNLVQESHQCEMLSVLLIKNKIR